MFGVMTSFFGHNINSGCSKCIYLHVTLELCTDVIVVIILQILCTTLSTYNNQGMCIYGSILSIDIDSLQLDIYMYISEIYICIYIHNI